jgi:hypothetical protein
LLTLPPAERFGSNLAVTLASVFHAKGLGAGLASGLYFIFSDPTKEKVITQTSTVIPLSCHGAWCAGSPQGLYFISVIRPNKK